MIARVMLVAYREDEWEALRPTAEDRDELCPTWKEWNEQGKKYVKQLEARGIKYEWLPFDVEKCQQYCRQRGIPNDADNRVFFSEWLHTNHMQ
jgi:hypothetical protein